MEIIPQGVWRWKIAAYLFLAGMGAGAYAIGVLGDLVGGVPLVAQIGISLGIPIVAISTLFLIWDLGRPQKFLLAAMHPSTSWISRGFIILSLLLVVGVLNWGLWIWPFNTLVGNSGLRAVLEIVGLAAAVATCIYTGILIGVIISRPFWNSPLLPVLFLVSAISTGIASLFFATPIIYGVQGTAVPQELSKYLRTLGEVDLALIILEAIAVYLYLAVVFDRAPEAANLLMRGPLSGLFWGGFVTIGLVIPAIIEYVAFFGGLNESAAMAAEIVAGVLVIAGGFVLRALILAAGIRSPLYVRVAFRVRQGV